VADRGPLPSRLSAQHSRKGSKGGRCELRPKEISTIFTSQSEIPRLAQRQCGRNPKIFHELGAGQVGLPGNGVLELSCEAAAAGKAQGAQPVLRCIVRRLECGRRAAPIPQSPAWAPDQTHRHIVPVLRHDLRHCPMLGSGEPCGQSASRFLRSLRRRSTVRGDRGSSRAGRQPETGPVPVLVQP